MKCQARRGVELATMTFRANTATGKDGDEEASDPWDDDGDSDDKDGGTPDRDRVPATSEGVP